MWFNAVHYGVGRETGRIDLDEVRDVARRERPKLIFCGGTAFPRTIDFPAFAEIADEVGAILAADIAHIAGLVAGGAHPSPVGIADVVTTTTHKTLRGPRGGMILSKAEHAKAIDKAVFPGPPGRPAQPHHRGHRRRAQGGVDRRFKAYAHQIVANAKALAGELSSRGFDLVTGGTDNHLLLIDLTSKDVAGKVAAQALDRAGSWPTTTRSRSTRASPSTPRASASARRRSPAAAWARTEMRQIAGWMDQVVTAAASGDEAVLERVAGEVTDLTKGYPAPGILL